MKSVGYEKPLLVELSMLHDTAHGFSEPDPPSSPGEGNGGEKKSDEQESDSYEWL
ncbi:hypothetical protein BMS3Bbin04_00385 [bacterium BMS3Bbin04]|nr:hypothetical protein BMS3Bbin04_00385 [bacterium BMS3Bbin04]